MPTVTTQGSARAALNPDHAQLGLAASTVATTATGALEVVSAQLVQLKALLAGHGISDDDVRTSGVTVAEEWQWANDSNTLIGYRATVDVTVCVRQLDQVGVVLSAAVDAARCQIRGLSWGIDPAHPLHHELLGLAAQDARRRAQAYAAGLGLELGAIEELSEIAPSSPAPIEVVMQAKALRMDQSLPISPGRLTIEASVYARFALITPTP